MSKVVLNNVNRISRLFQPLDVIPRDLPVKTDISKSYKHMISAGLIRRISNGMYALLPLGLRVLEKLTNIVDYEMFKINAQKVLLPALTPTELWMKTDRLRESGQELFTLRDRHNISYVLGPTHEETITSLLSSVGPVSPKILPLRLYQVSSKWRDERKPRLGFIRSREFIMKDLYTFDTGTVEAEATYELVSEAYNNILKRIGIPFIKAVGSTGAVGGSLSHEYHYITEIGEDVVLSCSQCNYHINKNIADKLTCPSCENPLTESNTVEIGHSFLLGTKYSKPLDATYHSNHEHFPLSMGCYGLGMTRLIAAAIEILSTDQEIRWPFVLAPYIVCIIPPKSGSKEEKIGNQSLERICDMLLQSGIDFVVDDRTNLTIGNRMIHSKICGFPFVIVIGKLVTSSTPLFEFHDLTTSTREDVSIDILFSFLDGISNNERINKTFILSDISV